MWLDIMEEKLCVKWNDFHENINSSFASIRKDFEFSDVTLACEDGQQVEAHRVILAASSPFFQRLFRRNKHPHPLLYMRDVAFQDLVAIVDFLYCGEANIFQQDLDSFLDLAEDLKLEGMTGQAAAYTESTWEKSASTENKLSMKSTASNNLETYSDCAWQRFIVIYAFFVLKKQHDEREKCSLFINSI